MRPCPTCPGFASCVVPCARMEAELRRYCAGRRRKRVKLVYAHELGDLSPRFENIVYGSSDGGVNDVW